MFVALNRAYFKTYLFVLKKFSRKYSTIKTVLKTSTGE